jgi:DNA-binding transcriptional LysR family regulator
MMISPTLDQLRAFLSVARLGGVRRAAQQMNLSQPAVTARIGSLEAVLSTRLFERGSAGVTLTKSGEALLAHAERIEAELEAIRESVMAPGDLHGVLRLGVAETIAQAWLPDFVARLADRYPRLSLEVTVDISRNLRDGLLGRALDLALLMGPVSDYSIDNADLPPFELGWFRAARRPSVDLATVPVISYARNTRPFREIRDALRARHGAGVRLFPTTSLSAGFEMVAADLGVGALPRTLARDMLAAGRIVEFDPGWHPSALHFTASWRAETGDFLIVRAAELARQTALDHAGCGSSERGDPNS